MDIYTVSWDRFILITSWRIWIVLILNNQVLDLYTICLFGFFLFFFSFLQNIMLRVRDHIWIWYRELWKIGLRKIPKLFSWPKLQFNLFEKVKLLRYTWHLQKQHDESVFIEVQVLMLCYCQDLGQDTHQILQNRFFRFRSCQNNKSKIKLHFLIKCALFFSFFFSFFWWHILNWK